MAWSGLWWELGSYLTSWALFAFSLWWCFIDVFQHLRIYFHISPWILTSLFSSLYISTCSIVQHQVNISKKWHHSLPCVCFSPTSCSVGGSEIMSTYANYRQPTYLWIPPPLPAPDTLTVNNKKRHNATSTINQVQVPPPHSHVFICFDQIPFCIAVAKGQFCCFCACSWNSFKALQVCVQCGVCACVLGWRYSTTLW